MRHLVLIVLFELLLLAPSSVYAIDLSLGLHQPWDKVQNKKGSEADDPISPYLAIGHVFEISEQWRFTPRLGYISHTVKSNDHYSKYKIESFFLLYDFAWKHSFDASFFPRIGVGTFLKKVKGEGGTVTVPNGGGYSTAYRPGSSKASSTASLNLGFDWNLSSNLDLTAGGYGVSFEAFIFEILESKKRMFTLSAGVYYFF